MPIFSFKSMYKQKISQNIRHQSPCIVNETKNVNSYSGLLNNNCLIAPKNRDRFCYCFSLEIVCFQKISIPPHGWSFSFNPPPPWNFHSRGSVVDPPPPRIFQVFFWSLFLSLNKFLALYA